ncbi:MAG TPA: ATP-binding protein [Candidatus Saccharicenans sp.]|nr:ATP-binding protein [Candidatus Saccharicenans sp.]
MKFNPKFRISIYAQLVFWVSVILAFLIIGVLAVIQNRETRFIYEEKRNRGLLMIRYIAEMNARHFALWELESIDENIAGLIREDLAYVIFYDRSGRPVVVSESIVGNMEVINETRCAGDVPPEAIFYQNLNLSSGQEDYEVLQIEIPIYVAGSDVKWGSVKIGLKLDDVKKRINQSRLTLFSLGLLALLLTITGINFLVKRLTRPIQNLLEGTRRISRGDFSYHIPLISSDEIGVLTESFNRMTEELNMARQQMEEANKKLVQAEKLASIGKLSATIAHEIRNPLTSVKLNIQKLADNDQLDEVEKEHLSIAYEGIEQIEKFIKELLSFTRVSVLQLDHFGLDQIIEESLKMLLPSMTEKRIQIKKNYQPGLPPVLADGDKLRQVFLNVLRNAYEAVREGGEIEISLSLQPEGEKSYFEVRICDTGSGIPEKDWENIFEPFFTTKSSGAGLGLANARRIVEQHGGTIRVVRKEGPGSCFLIRIPCETQDKEKKYD